MIRRPPRSTPFPTRRSSDLDEAVLGRDHVLVGVARESRAQPVARFGGAAVGSEEHTSELQSPLQLVCRLLLEKKIPPRVLATSHIRTACGDEYSDKHSCLRE